MKKYWVMISFLILIGCQNQKTHSLIKTEFVCEDMESVRRYTIECINGAGRSGDSEPEDWLYQCKNLAKELLCQKKNFVIIYMQDKNQIGLIEISRRPWKNEIEKEN